jgi:hypothetical protein
MATPEFIALRAPDPAKKQCRPPEALNVTEDIVFV